MPLHLLGKKSWNVYNTASIERVRRDEADAKAKEEAAEQRMQEEDAAIRTAILRGERIPNRIDAAAAVSDSAAPPAADQDTDAPERRKRHADADPVGLPRERERKRRRLRGEDDTDRDVRYAREDAAIAERARQTLSKRDAPDADLVDHAGHVQLIPPPDEKTLRKAEKNAEVEAEKAKKRKREEDQYTMRFSNAAGFNNDASSKPWYASNKLAKVMEASSAVVVLSDVQEKDVWGNEDPRRKVREQSRVSTNDPFAAMQQAQRQLKKSERDKERWTQQRLADVDESVRRRPKHRDDHRRRRDQDEGSLENFQLDEPQPSGRKADESRDDARHRRRHRHRSRSRSRERPHRHHHRGHRSSRDRGVNV